MEENEKKTGGWKKTCLVVLGVLLVLAVLAFGAMQIFGPPFLRYQNHVVKVHRGIETNVLEAEHFSTDSRGRVNYEKDGVRAKLGVDVSYYQGVVDWTAVKTDGVDFAVVRLGRRGYNTGLIEQDQRFEENYAGAAAAGLDVGVYFFSQAVTPEEAEAEADFVLSVLQERELQYPVVYDWEFMTPDREARTDGMTGEQIAQCAAAFCRKIEAAGYESMVYFNTSLGYLGLDLSQIKEYPFWLAQYQDCPEFYYRFDLWQFTHTGEVQGIGTPVDLNLDLRPFY